MVWEQDSSLEPDHCAVATLPTGSTARSCASVSGRGPPNPWQKGCPLSRPRSASPKAGEVLRFEPERFGHSGIVRRQGIVRESMRSILPVD